MRHPRRGGRRARGIGVSLRRERERGTLDLLLLRWDQRIVLGKVLAALVFSLLLLAVGVPFLPRAWSFGGYRLTRSSR